MTGCLVLSTPLSGSSRPRPIITSEALEKVPKGERERESMCVCVCAAPCSLNSITYTHVAGIYCFVKSPGALP